MTQAAGCFIEASWNEERAMDGLCYGNGRRSWCRSESVEVCKRRVPDHVGYPYQCVY